MWVGLTVEKFTYLASVELLIFWRTNWYSDWCCGGTRGDLLSCKRAGNLLRTLLYTIYTCFINIIVTVNTHVCLLFIAAIISTSSGKSPETIMIIIVLQNSPMTWRCNTLRMRESGAIINAMACVNATRCTHRSVRMQVESRHKKNEILNARDNHSCESCSRLKSMSRKDAWESRYPL